MLTFSKGLLRYRYDKQFNYVSKFQFKKNPDKERIFSVLVKVVPDTDRLM